MIKLDLISYLRCLKMKQMKWVSNTPEKSSLEALPAILQGMKLLSRYLRIKWNS
jgi:hypothetical protein